jgi:hypothetical protein
MFEGDVMNYVREIRHARALTRACAPAANKTDIAMLSRRVSVSFNIDELGLGKL